MNKLKAQMEDTEKELIDKIYYTINEVSGICDVRAHVLRYWEQEFEQLNNIVRRGNRRYYQAKDIQMINKIKHLLYDRGFTILGAKQFLEEENSKYTKNSLTKIAFIKKIIFELQEVQNIFKS